MSKMSELTKILNEVRQIREMSTELQETYAKVLTEHNKHIEVYKDLISRSRILIDEMIHKGLIYWEPVTDKGLLYKAEMLTRAEIFLKILTDLEEE